MTALKTSNLGLKFLLELAAIGAFAYWGASHSPVVVAVVLGIVAPAVFVVVWGLWAAPRSSRRLPRSIRVPFELGVFALAAVGLIAAGATAAGVVFAVVAVGNAALLAAFGQLDA